MKIVFDTNIYIAAALNRGFIHRLVQEIVTDREMQVFISKDIIVELQNKMGIFLNKGLIQPYNVVYVFETIRASTQTVEPKEQISVQEVASDDFKILECAVAAEADLIVTMDQVLLRLKRFRNIGIVHPKTFSFMFPQK
ncbi:MAG: putative toxin-antitoxin system toxin component, PIN family [Candidatus Doudnabacteria bacterium RIFCSPHIGHO2_02_FULL_48_21]|uniref:Putative toxin-antitoxin system toxin component, PIN family n=1 Tax=Candidatus Doudnabacteria bacterium RIFCSPLOWO2_02_FULL_48_13 TaxID=1817845 RepID=A0A1F5Q8N7_9BACT|nr:MAG: putative toxin-antitoxin system toxin component, PIN family [Candidatus Doudnabacteria bacterium RIFCSPHIGHO2_01_48_18]OGE78033.1 MAG: putative toxin-antitoxin system toxin component, PIN family [Candidatus Doudnabacteria bacterium RIFCSPHIGHO2_01_FULL_48_180]OGE91368.1 MAG: putative toxin-antitoxin system toxin component, PIN family [Candidatus Doudnabacteria bacterium RIFCSPHIGHO2_12_FULL_47_25]OGE93180.1 MAG: putative toxin-antitoxin system toxin component, PIN family [Candidatus Doud